MAPCGIDRNNASHGGDAAHGRVRAEHPAMSREQAVEIAMDDPCLHPDCRFVDAENSTKIARKVDNQSAPHRLAREPGASAARVNG
jgi:hypothetical protein